MPRVAGLYHGDGPAVAVSWAKLIAKLEFQEAMGTRWETKIKTHPTLSETHRSWGTQYHTGERRQKGGHTWSCSLLAKVLKKT